MSYFIIDQPTNSYNEYLGATIDPIGELPRSELGFIPVVVLKKIINKKQGKYRLAGCVLYTKNRYSIIELEDRLIVIIEDKLPYALGNEHETIYRFIINRMGIREYFIFQVDLLEYTVKYYKELIEGIK